MSEQLTGFLREVLAVADGKPRPSFSSLFSPELHAIGAEASFAGEADGAAAASAPAAHPAPPAEEVVAMLPVPQVDAADPAAGYLATLSTLDPAQRNEALSAAAAGEQGVPPEVGASPETRLGLACRETPAPRSMPSATHCPASWRPSSRSDSPPRPPETRRRPGIASRSC